jgi:hypothetical protein
MSGYGGGAFGAPRVGEKTSGARGFFGSGYRIGGGAGGGGTVLDAGPPGVGAPAINGWGSAPNGGVFGGGSGASSPYGMGGAGGNHAGGGPHIPGYSALITAYGAGGGGAGATHSYILTLGGDGAPGYLLVEWIA